MSAISDWLFGAAGGPPLEGDMLRRPDILQASWHGVSLAELVRSQLSSYLDRIRPQVLIVGDGVLLKPDSRRASGWRCTSLRATPRNSGPSRFRTAGSRSRGGAYRKAMAKG